MLFVDTERVQHVLSHCVWQVPNRPEGATINLNQATNSNTAGQLQESTQFEHIGEQADRQTDQGMRYHP